jgi:ribosomal protein S18 acetylase RimI-like enzyme
VTVQIAVARLTTATPEAVDRINALIPQLKPAWDPVTVAGLAQMIESPTRVYVARCDQSIVGMALLVPHRHLPGLRYHIEDVVVDTAYRRQGIARTLLTAAMADVADGVLSFDLRSHDTRRAAHALYVGLGFEPSETTVFRRPLRSG